MYVVSSKHYNIVWNWEIQMQKTYRTQKMYCLIQKIFARIKFLIFMSTQM